MNIELILLITESILLLVTLGFLLYSIHEGQQRSRLLVEVKHATKTLTRVEYFLTISESLLESKHEVVGCVTGRRPLDEEERKIENVINSIKHATSRGVKVKYILPKLPDRLYMGCLYESAGAEIRYAGCSLVHSMRYMVVDNSSVLIGTPESAGEKNATNRGHKLPSMGLAVILKNHFDECWEKDLPVLGYIKEVMAHSGMSIKQVSTELGIDIKVLSRYVVSSPPQAT
jgi:hypothetical protein